MTLEDLFIRFQSDIASGRDLHILRHYSSFIVVSEGKVIDMTAPLMTSCPLADFLYPDLKNAGSQGLPNRKTFIKETIEKKIRESGQFSARREICDSHITVPYGSSEIIMYALQKNVVDAAVVVCDGAGTVVTDKPHIVQGVGGHMNGLFWTSPIKGIQERLKDHGCCLPSQGAEIDQVAGIENAIRFGHKRIVVTVNAFRGESLQDIRAIEQRLGVTIYIFVVCTTGVGRPRIDEIKKFADVVWSCGSVDIRREIGAEAILQLSKAIPVFVLTEKGVDVVKTYFQDASVLNGASKDRPFLICDDCAGENIRVGNFTTRICAFKLPVFGKRQPLFKNEMSPCKSN